MRVYENVLKRAPMPTDMYIVSKTGVGDFTDIQTAINTVPEGSKIYICAGVYYTNLQCAKEIEIIGASKHSVTIYNDYNDYARPPLSCSKGKFKNLTFYAKCPATIPAVANTYACHIDGFSTAGLTEQRIIESVDCMFISELNPAIGAGTSYMTTFRFVDCEFTAIKKFELTGTEKGGFYCHGSSNNTAGANQIIELIRCRSFTNHVDAAYIEGGSDNILIAENCYFWQTNKNTNGVHLSMAISPRNYGNNNPILNYTT
jgi:hypothetical protein